MKNANSTSTRISEVLTCITIAVKFDREQEKEDPELRSKDSGIVNALLKMGIDSGSFLTSELAEIYFEGLELKKEVQDPILVASYIDSQFQKITNFY